MCRLRNLVCFKGERALGNTSKGLKRRTSLQLGDRSLQTAVVALGTRILRSTSMARAGDQQPKATAGASIFEPTSNERAEEAWEYRLAAKAPDLT